MKHKKQAAQERLENIIKINIEKQEEHLTASGSKIFFRGKEARAIAILALAFVLLFGFLFFFMLDLRNGNMSVAWILKQAGLRMTDLINFFSGQQLDSGIHFFLYRLIMAAAAGAALAVAGSVYQAVFRNPMASPTMLGVSSGGALFAALYILFFTTASAASSSQVSDLKEQSFLAKLFMGNIVELVIMLGCLASLCFVVAIAKAAGKGKLQTLPMILTGTVFSSLCVTVISMIQSYFRAVDDYSTRMDALGNIMTGSFDLLYTSSQMLAMTTPILIGILLLMPLGKKLNILTFGEEEAQTMGMPVLGYKLIFLVLATFVTSVVVAFCGAFCFLGLVAPHMCRNLVGANNKYVLPASAFMGAILMLLSYGAAYACGRTSLVNIVLAVLGGIIFAVFIVKGKGGSYE